MAFRHERFEGGYRYIGGVFVPFNDVMREECNKHFEEGKVYILTDMNYSKKKKRSILQNASLHKYLDLLAIALNNAGYDLKRVLESMRKGFSVQCTKENIKETVWRPMQSAMFGIESTTELDTKQVSEVYMNVNKFTSETLKVSIPWPDKYNQSFEDL